MVVIKVTIKKPFQDESRIWNEFNRVLGFRGEVDSLFRMKGSRDCVVIIKSKDTWKVSDAEKLTALRSWIPAKLQQLEVIAIEGQTIHPNKGTATCPPSGFRQFRESIVPGVGTYLSSVRKNKGK